jgi:hypothetical protein
MTVVSYHVEQGGTYYSLNHVHRTLEEAKRACHETEDMAISCEIDLDETYYGEYTASTVPRGTFADADLSQYSETTLVLVETILGASTALERQQRPKWYKPVEEDGIARAIQRTEWKQSVAETGGEMISELILRHALANTNHRTSIAVLELYCRTFGDLPRIPETGSDEGWEEWINEYIIESKRLLTIRRNSGPLGYLAERGATAVERKHDILIPFDKYNPTINDPYGEFGARYREASVEFVRAYLERAGVPDRANEPDRGLRVLAARLN